MIPGIVAGRAVEPSPEPAFNPVINLPFEGSDGSTTITDTTGRSWTRVGNAQISTAQSAVGGSSLLLDGAGDYLSTASHASIQMAGDFRMRCYIRSAVTGGTKCIASKRPVTGSSEFYLVVNSTGLVQFTSWNNDVAVVGMASSTGISADTWYKIEVRRTGVDWQLLVNDHVEASTTQSAPPQTNNELFLIGRDRTNTGRDWDGYIDQFVMERPA